MSDRPASALPGESRRKGTIALAASSYVLVGLHLVQGVLLVPLYLRFVGELLYGAWLATGNIIAYLGLLDLGLNSVIIQKVAEAYGARDLPRLRRYLGSGLGVALVLSMLPALMGWAGGGQLPRIIPIPAGEEGTLKLAFIVAGVSTSLMLGAYAAGGVLCAFQRQLVHGLLVVGSTALGLLATVGLLFRGYGLLAIPLGSLLQSSLCLAGELAACWFFKRRLLGPARLRWEWATVRELLQPAVTLFLARGGSTLVRQSDNLLIALVLDARAVLIYALTKRAFEALAMLAGHFVGAFVPALAHLFGEVRDRLAVRGLTGTLLHVTGVLGLVLMGGYVVLNQAFMALWVGPELYAGDLVTLLIGFYGFLYVLSLAFYHIIFAQGRLYLVALANGSEALLRIALVLALLHFLGLPGAALGALGSLAATGLWILPAQYRRDFKVSGGEAFRGATLLALVAAGIMVIGLLCRQLSAPTTVLPFVVYGGGYLGSALLWVVLVDRRMRMLLADFCRGQPLALIRPT
jgi:O-antigen/teichoic acid export membrane protein